MQRDRRPRRAVAGLVDRLVHGLVELERGEQVAVDRQVEAGCRDVAVEEGLPRGIRPRDRRRRRARAAPAPSSRPRSRTSAACRRRRARGGRGAAGRAWGAAARPRSRAAPSRARHEQHLAEVQVAVDALQLGPRTRLRAGVERLDRRALRARAPAPRRRRCRGDASTPAVMRSTSSSDGCSRGNSSPSERCTSATAAPRARDSSVNGGIRGRRGQRHAPRVLDARQELLREREVSRALARRAADVVPLARHVADARRHVRRAG